MIIERANFNLRSIFPNFDPRLAARIKKTVRQTELPMVNAGARDDVDILLMSGARTGIFVDKNDRSDWVIHWLKNDENTTFLSDKGKYPRDISFRYDGTYYRILYYKNDIKNLPAILRDQRIAFYYSAIQAGPEIIPNAAFNALIKGGFLVSPTPLGFPKACLEITGLRAVSQLIGDPSPDPFVIGDGMLYRKARSIDHVQVPGFPTLEVFSYLTNPH